MDAAFYTADGVVGSIPLFEGGNVIEIPLLRGVDATFFVAAGVWQQTG